MNNTKIYGAAFAVVGIVAAALVVRHRESIPAVESQVATVATLELKSDSLASERSDEKSPPRRSDMSGDENSNRQREYYQTTNLLPFVKRAAFDAVINHDGRAAYYVGEALRGCALVLLQIIQDPAFANNFDDEYAKMAPKAPDWARVKARREFDRCAPLATADTFAALPSRQNGYGKAAFWSELALSENDPLAKAHQAYSIVIGSTGKPANGAFLLQQAQQYLDDVAKSGDTSALFLAGQLLSSGQGSSNPLRGVAISLAACDLGYDCSANNPANSFYACKESGGCPADADYSFYMQTTLGARDFATAYSISQTFKDLLARQDWDGLASLMKLDGTVARN
ncbi:MAG: hypothetical protein ABI356_09585 [Steroidobacteraceae bacterium]